MLTEIGIFEKCSNLYLVRGHTKNACDRMFMLLKQHFHYKNIYTKEQLNINLNQNDGVEAIEINSEFFNEIDEMLDCFYKRLESGSINRTHIFLWNIQIQESSNLKIPQTVKSKRKI